MEKPYFFDEIGQTNKEKPPASRSPLALELDNLMRRSLRVSDPANFEEVAKALTQKYPMETRQMKSEAVGQAYSSVAPAVVSSEQYASTGAEFTQARQDVEKDLQSLMQNALLKDIVPELQGWASAIRRAIADGFNTARFALDPNQRDRAFAVRRLLGNYARLARYVGALTPNLSPDYRQLAKSLDEVSGVLLVIMGEALANIGFGGGRFLLQAPAGELQERRDAVIFALRNLTGATHDKYGPNDWPRGLHAYRGFRDRLSRNGQHDLRALFQEIELSRLMDELIQHATGNNAEGYRALGATAHIALERFRRLILFARGSLSPESPPVATFLTAMNLFLDAFENADSGYRLLKISRPPILFYGLYGIGEQDDASQRLISLIIERGNLANALDCLLGCDCGPRQIRCQIVLDKILFDVDRAIDYYALGQEDFGDAEQRAAAFGYLINTVITEIDSGELCPGIGDHIPGILSNIQAMLWFYHFTNDDFLGLPDRDLTCAFAANLPSDNPIAIGPDLARGLKLFDDCPDTADPGVYGCIKQRLIDEGMLDDCSDDLPPDQVPASITRLERMLRQIREELCFQVQTEQSWRSLLQTMAPSCRTRDDTLNQVKLIIDDALQIFSGNGGTCPEFRLDIPPHHETSLDSIANDILKTGEGR